MNLEKIVNENGFVFKNKTSETYVEKIVLKITADPNDLDNITEETEFLLDEIDEEYLTSFLNVVKVLLKLVNPGYPNHSKIFGLWDKLTDEDITILYKFDFDHLNEEFKDDDLDETNFEDYNIFDECAWQHDSSIREWFPSGEYDMEDSHFIKNCHSLNGIELFYHDAEGNIVEILKEI